MQQCRILPPMPLLGMQYVREDEILELSERCAKRIAVNDRVLAVPYRYDAFLVGYC